MQSEIFSPLPPSPRSPASPIYVVLNFDLLPCCDATPPRYFECRNEGQKLSIMLREPKVNESIPDVAGYFLNQVL